MATPSVPASLGLYETAAELVTKGRYARAAEKLEGAAAAAAQELAAEDCLVVALLRAEQASAVYCHSVAPTLTVAEADEARETIKSVLLPQFLSTLTRRKAAGTLLPGRCRAAEVAWFWAAVERKLLQDGAVYAAARASAEAAAPEVGLDAYLKAAYVTLDVLRRMGPLQMPREMQRSLAAFVASAFELMAQPRELLSIVADNNTCVLSAGPEQLLARNARRTFQNETFCSNVDGEAFFTLVTAWQRVERSGAIAMRQLDADHFPTLSIRAGLAAAAADAAVRGLHECALDTCASKEVHVSQFKRCGACRTVSYCCREHQLADWPAHKAACKAARKATPVSK